MCDCECCRTRCGSTYDRPRWGLPGWCGCSCGNCIATYASKAYAAGRESLRGEMEERAAALTEVERLTGTVQGLTIGADALAAEVERLTREVNRLNHIGDSRIVETLALHLPHACTGIPFGGDPCGLVFGGACRYEGCCRTCRVLAPCPTVQALRGDHA